MAVGDEGPRHMVRVVPTGEPPEPIQQVDKGSGMEPRGSLWARVIPISFTQVGVSSL